MATPYNLTPDWTATNRFEAVTAGEILLSNTGGFDIRWTRTPDAAAPAPMPLQATILRPGESRSLSLKAGEYLWLAARPQGSAIVEDFG
ncbi:MAG: hypothetical protein CML66_01610 [Rhodobacteraceae bacterium]|nr:hypothetical protein [Paracoccaceae bacterium]MAY45930.1 hypothetical protein [Paracoccaceae bacterium]|tara:strand:- start:388 stop:654 length:267 start_codon:yes stop_codon:yes gene_type:complete